MSDSKFEERLIRIEKNIELILHEKTASRPNGKNIVLNARGTRFEIPSEGIERFENFSDLNLENHKPFNLKRLAEQCDFYDEEYKEYYFDRDPEILRSILNSINTNEKLHFNNNYCASYLRNELKCWNIEMNQLGMCCRYRITTCDIDALDRENCQQNNSSSALSLNVNFTLMDKVKFYLANITQNNRTRKTAQVLLWITNIMIVISTVDLVIRTIPGICMKTNSHDKNSSKSSIYLVECNSENFANVFDLIEYACIGWFSSEIILRLATARAKLRCLSSIFTLIDLTAVIPFYMNICFQKYGNDFKLISNICRMLKIITIFKFARYSVGLKLLGSMFKNSFKEIVHLMLFAGILILIFSSFLYYSERDMNNTKFTSIPESFWWAIVTISTTGYGDMVPETFMGKTLAAYGIIFGMLFLALPIAVVASSFSEQIKIAKKNKLLKEISC